MKVNVDQYVSAGKRFCDLELWTRDLEAVTSVTRSWYWVTVTSFITTCSCIHEIWKVKIGLTDRRTVARADIRQPDCLTPLA